MNIYSATLRLKGSLIPIEVRASNLDHARKLVQSMHPDAAILNLHQKS